VPKRVENDDSASTCKSEAIYHHANPHSDASIIAGSLTVTFKSAKPPLTYSLTISPSDTISHIKSLLHTTHASAPSSDAQRLLLKGKALVDTKLVKEYNVKDGDTINLMIKPGFTWDPSNPTPPPPSAVLTPSSPSLEPTIPPKKHGRTPSIVLSPSPSMENLHEVPADITLSLEGDEGRIVVDTTTPYRETLARPEFWERMLAFLRYLEFSLFFLQHFRS
jgi:ubiquitin-like protein 4